MRGRRVWALLAVFAVLTMYGLQCLGGAIDAAPAPPAAAVPFAGPGGHATASVDGGHHAAAPGAPASAPHHSAPDGVPAHGAEAWTICLAVAFAALALVSVATLFRGRAALLVRGPPPLMPRLRRRYRLPPAPDLSALCLLRI